MPGVETGIIGTWVLKKNPDLRHVWDKRFMTLVYLLFQFHLSLSLYVYV